MERKKIKFIVQKDDFKGSRLISTSWVYIGRNAVGEVYDEFEVANEYEEILYWAHFDAFRLQYIELDNGMGEILIDIFSSKKFISFDEPNVMPKWKSDFPLIIDGERCLLEQFSKKEKGDGYEKLSYKVPVDILAKIAGANQVQFSLRGENYKLEGALLPQHIKVFKALEQYCFVDESEGENIFNSLNKEIDELIERERIEKAEKEKKSSEAFQKQVEASKAKSSSKTKSIILFVVLFGAIIIFKETIFSKSSFSETSSLNGGEEKKKKPYSDEPGTYLVYEDMMEGATLFNVDKKTKRGKKAPVFTKIYIKKVEDSLGFFENFMDDEMNSFSKGWVKMTDLVPEKDYFTYPYGENYWIKSDATEVETYTDYKMKKNNKRKLKPMQEIKVYYIRDSVAYFNNGILDNYRKGWIELKNIEKQ